MPIAQVAIQNFLVDPEGSIGFPLLFEVLGVGVIVMCLRQASDVLIWMFTKVLLSVRMRAKIHKCEHGRARVQSVLRIARVSLQFLRFRCAMLATSKPLTRISSSQCELSKLGQRLHAICEAFSSVFF